MKHNEVITIYKIITSVTKTKISQINKKLKLFTNLLQIRKRVLLCGPVITSDDLDIMPFLLCSNRVSKTEVGLV